MSGATFSRLQLAAALIEYDNDPTNPDAPFRSAQDSAIFLSARRAPARDLQQQGADALSETRSVMDGASHVGAIPEAATEEEAEEHGSEPEVDLASWGLDTFIKPEKKPKKSAAKLAEARAAVARAGDQTHQRSLSIPLPAQADADTVQPAGLRTTRARASTLNVRDGLSAAPPDLRRMSYASPLDLVGVQPDDSLKARPVSMFAAMDVHEAPARSGTPASLSPRPFPADAGDDSPFAVPLSSPTSRFDPKFAAAHARTMSNATMGSRLDNPFAVPLPAGEGSRFDPKAAHARTMSNATMMSKLQADSSPYAVPPEQGERPDSTFMDEPYGLPAGARGSTYGAPGGRARTMSMASMGSRMLLDPTALEPPSRPTMPERGSWRYSKMDLMRPKVLVMPVPLSEQDNAPEEHRRDGFLVSTDGPPLPPGARTRPVSSRLPSSTGSNGLTFNPRQSLTLSQLTFRNTLLVDGQRDVSYVDVDDALPRAQEDGQQVDISHPEEIDEFGQLAQPESRAPGSLYGRSLIDDLEQRKAQMKGKQRVFTGDNRPSMMQRGARRTTFIDPESLQQRPVSGALLDRPGLGPRQSSAPLLDFNDRPTSGVANTKSVFGVDQLWERELAKLQQIEEAERKAADEEKQRVEHKSARKRKGKAKGEAPAPAASPQQERAASPPPLLPTVHATGGKPVPAPQASSSDTESEDEVKLTRARRASVGTMQTLGAKGWFASSDEEDGPGAQRRPRPVQGQRRPEQRRTPPARLPAVDSDSDDVPLSQLPRQAGGSDSDSDKPLAALVEKQRPSLPMPELSLGGPLLPVSKPLARPPKAVADSDDDDVPLGLKQSRSRTSLAPKADSDDDDKPLGLRASRISQYPTGFGGMPGMPMPMAPQVPMFTPQQMLMQAQMQAQMQQSMYSFAAPSLMGGYAPAMSMPMMAATPMAPVAAPQDPGTFGRVDRWRHDVSAIPPEGGAPS